MNLVDRAARAIAASQNPSENWEKIDSIGQERLKEGVRMALNILRDPNEDMMQAGAEIIRNVRLGESETAYLNDAANTWRFMIDALLANDERGMLREPD